MEVAKSEAVPAGHQHAQPRHSAGWRSVLDGRMHLVYAALIYLVIALVMFYPLTMHLNSYIPGTGGDSYANAWDFWWIRYAVFHGLNAYQTNLLFWPIGVNLAYWTQTPLSALISIPFQFFGVISSYNIMLFLGFAASGIGMFILADYLVKNRYAAFIAGLIFTFSTFHIAQGLAHIDFIQLEWIPLFLYFLLQMIQEKRDYRKPAGYYNIIGLSACFALATMMGVAELSVMLVLLFLMVVLAYAFYPRTRQKVLNLNFIAAILIFVVAAFLIGSWNFVPLLNTISHSGGLSVAGQGTAIQNNEIWSANLLAFFLPSFYNGALWLTGLPQSLYGSLYYPDTTERVAYIGFAALLLSIYAFYKLRKNPKILMFSAFAIIFAWLSLGPYLQVGGAVTGIPTLYYLYRLIPLFNLVREPGRFTMMLMLFISLLAAYGAKELIEKHGRNNRNRIITGVAILSIIILFEMNAMPLGGGFAGQIVSEVQVPQFYVQLASLPGNFSVLQLPTLPLKASSVAPIQYAGEDTYYTSISHKPIIGGYEARLNISEEISLYDIPLVVEASNLDYYGVLSMSSPINQNYTNQTLLSLYNYDTPFLVVHRNAYNQSSLHTLFDYITGVFGTPIYNDTAITAFSTVNAVNDSAFRSYVSYPSLTEWKSGVIPVNGTNLAAWVPVGGGGVVVYAPFANATASQISSLIQSSATHAYPIDTRLTFSAASTTPEAFAVERLTQQGTQTIAMFNLSSTLQSYSANITLLSGPVGNPLYFVPQYNGTVYTYNITFSRAH